MHETLLPWLDKDIEQVQNGSFPPILSHEAKYTRTNYAMRVEKRNKIWQFGQITPFYSSYYY